MSVPIIIPAPGSQKVADEFIIKFRQTAPPGSAARKDILDLFKAPDGEILVDMTPQVFDGLVVSTPAAGLLMAKLKVSPNIEYIAENSGNLKTHGIVQKLDLPANPTRWALSRISHKGIYNSANGLFEYPNTAGAGVNIYIVDTGVNANLSPDAVKELGGRVSADGFSAINGEPFNQDTLGHGTWIANVAGGVNNGVAKLSNLISVKVMKQDQTGEFSSAGHVFKAMNWIYANAGARRDRSVINASGGGPAFLPIDELFTNMDNAGFYVVVSAGQDQKGVDASTVSPARCPSVITVGALNKKDQKPVWSNYGALVDFWAPGDGVCQLGGLMLQPIGTSPSAALVSGIIALYLGQNAGITKVALLDRMKRESDKLVIDAVNWPSGGLVPQVPA